MADTRHWEHCRCSNCGTFDGPHDEGYCAVCHDQGRGDAMVEEFVPAARLRGAVEEARAALRWIAFNADVPADFPNQHVRLRQIKARADEALDDMRGRYHDASRGGTDG